MAAKKSSRSVQKGRQQTSHRTPTTTIRVDVVTHGALMKLAEELDTTMSGLIRDALRHYRSKLMHQVAAEQLAELRKDPEAWDDFLGGEEHWPEFDHIITGKEK